MYDVPDMVLIPQDNNNACWYASARMVVEWKRRRDRMTSLGLRAPGEVSRFATMHAGNNGLPWVQMRRFAQDLGLTPLPLMTPSPDLLEEWLRWYGPIWTDGVPVDANGNRVGHGHVVVIAGIRESRTAGENYDLHIYDPWPPNTGDVAWRRGSHLSEIQSGVAESSIRDVSFLVAPR